MIIQLTVAVLAFFTNAAACRGGFVKGENTSSFYFLIGAGNTKGYMKDYFGAHLVCRSIGAKLAMIESVVEHDAVRLALNNVFKPDNPITRVWIDGNGFSNPGFKNQYYMSDGRKLDLPDRWMDNEPSSKNEERCASMLKESNYKLNDDDCLKPYTFLCQLSPCDCP